ncbi:hypothetical protein [Ramlibacter albus]|uniref:Uncharacterized protein n=1 Tax=Ramlibacter albus TaxID=2079448 RepID=A0A923M8L9_9BURK|nr:hypothetical protein [Ramlibacter albus]MBC5765828.1 hypothetical protein [Ramlibacter albus]
MQPARATCFAFVAASVLPALCVGIGDPLTGNRAADTMLVTFFIMYYFSAVATVLFGVPAYFAMRKFRAIRWWSATLVGIFAGVVMRRGVALPGGYASFEDLWNFGMLGAAAGFLFWAVWRLGHGPDAPGPK